MVKRMLVDANHPEETRVVVLDGTRLEEFDVETSTKKQNKGNIYLAKVVRVEPSLQAAFVDYGGERHGFLAFSEIHPDYYQIPVADREALIAEAREHDLNNDDDDAVDDVDTESDESTPEPNGQSDPKTAVPLEQQIESLNGPAVGIERTIAAEDGGPSEDQNSNGGGNGQDVTPTEDSQQDLPSGDGLASQADAEGEAENGTDDGAGSDAASSAAPGDTASDANEEESRDAPQVKGIVEELGGEDESEENLDAHRRKFVSSRRYKIQEVIKRRQILLVQVVKEERGNKGAALTTYLSLAGRYCVLMPNSSRGGGVSRKITNVKDRKRLKSILSDLSISEQMAVILRTAGAERSKAEVKRDYEYLLRTWNQIRETTMESRAPALIHEEANLIKRSIRDVYSRDIEEVLVEGDDGYKAAKEFMKTLTPSHAKKVQRYKDDSLPLFQRYQVESQLDAMHSPTVQLKSGGSIVFGQTEALVAIDVNSGRATKERHIEETALKTNLEAADEIARQLRLRDLAGLVVIDFIDMEENRNNHAVERRLKEALKSDRARIQVGRISHFGLLELSRQRLRPSLMETNFEVCKSCGGAGMIRSTESTSIQTLRLIEEEGLRNRTKELTVTVHPDVALYILNYKRAGLEEIQQRYGMEVFILGDADLVPPDHRMERIKGEPGSRPEPRDTKVDDFEDDDDTEVPVQGADDESQDQDGERKRRRRRRRRKKGDLPSAQDASETSSSETSDNDGDEPSSDTTRQASDDDDDDDRGERQRKGRRRGRRGGRRRRKHSSEDTGQDAAERDSSDNANPADGSEDSQSSDSGPSGEASGLAPADPIPVQPVYEPSTSPSSRFFNALKRGAEAFKTSSNGAQSDKNNGSAPEAAPGPVPSSAGSDVSNTPEDMKPATKAEPEPTAADDKSQSVASEAPPSQPPSEPKRGWWSQDS